MAELLRSSNPSIAIGGLSQNPALPLLPLECPDFATLLDPATIQFLLLESELPLPLLHLLITSSHPFLLAEARNHVVVAGEYDSESDWRTEWQKLLLELRQQSNDVEKRCADYEMRELGILPEWFVSDRHPLDDPGIRHELWHNLPEIPETVLHQALAFPDEVAEALQYCPAQPSDELPQTVRLYMQENRDPALRWALLRHPQTPPLILEALVHTAPWRLAVVRHPRCTSALRRACRQYVLCRLKTNKDECPAVRYLAARLGFHDSNSSMFLSRMVNAERLRVWHPRERRALQQLCNDPNRFVRARARERLKMPRRS